jgi:hypothetical protein
MPAKTPSLSDLYRLSAQLEQDRELSVREVRERDHALARDCPATDDVGRLGFWLAAVSAGREGSEGQAGPRLSEGSLAALGRVLAPLCGFAGMAAFLLGSGRGLVNVFMFVLLFVVLQALLSLVAAVVMLRTVGGGAPVMLPVNPARWLVARALPDGRYLREAQSVLRLLFLRYGQELGALFTLGAIGGFFVVLFLSPFTFVWGSTYQLSDGFVQTLTGLLATPWGSWLPQATVDSQVIAATRFHPAVTSLSPTELAAMGGWWPFLIMCMLCYALLPRLLLWLCSRYFYRRQMRAAFVGLPGSELVLARMQTPLVSTQGAAGSGRRDDGDGVPADRGLLLLNWAGALGPGDRSHFPEFAAVPRDREISAGLGSQPEELAQLQRLLKYSIEGIYVAVKSWEPPMADLADFLAGLGDLQRCTLFLVPLGSKPVSADKLEDWQGFARSLPFAAVAVHPLGRL